MNTAVTAHEALLLVSVVRYRTWKVSIQAPMLIFLYEEYRTDNMVPGDLLSQSLGGLYQGS